MAADLPVPIQAYLKQPGFTWKCEPSSHFQFCWEAGIDSDPNLAAARAAAEGDREGVLAMAGLPPVYEPLIYVFFLASTDRMQGLIGYRGEGRSRPVQHAIFFVPTPIRPSLRHELTHEILTNLWGAAESWIEEGFATLAGNPLDPQTRCITMTEDHLMLPLTNLVRPEWNPSIYSADVTYDELAGFVQFLKRAYGLERVKQVWQGGSVSIPKILGKSVAALEADWQVELQRGVALRVPH
jgi:hypothetical protein